MINAFTSDGSRIAELPTLSVRSSDGMKSLSNRRWADREV